MNDILKKYAESGRLYVSVAEFCRMVGWSSPFYYKMRAQDLTPEETRFPEKMVRISVENIDKWMKARANPSPEEARAIEAQKATLKQRSQFAIFGCRA